jgi:lipoprotein NlpD
MLGSPRQGWIFAALLAAGFVLAGCANNKVNRAPVEDRGTSVGRPASLPAPAGPVVGDSAIKPLPGIENAGKPGYYTVKPGDTLIRIGLETGQNWRDIVRWNNIENPNLIEVGQVLRVTPPGAGAATDTVAVARPVTQPNANPASPASAQAASAPRPAGSPAPVSAPAGEDEVAWIWPTNGTLLAGFDEVKNKGLDIGGKTGEPILASGDGRVVYAGAGLRGYGNLIILKHNNTFLTAYAHNQTLLVKEDQTVRKGQKIAEMGNSDADRVKLHFEIRRQGKPVDPAQYLPAR